jgi:hypothetical protein
MWQPVGLEPVYGRISIHEDEAVLPLRTYF